MKRFGIKMTLPEGDPLRLPHLLGSDWESSRWYDTAEERDKAFQAMNQHHPFYRIGDDPSQIMTKVER